MEKQDGSFISDGEGYNKEEFLFTYNEEEKQQNEINKNNAGLIFRPKFIPMYPELLQNGLTITESCLFGFIDFYLSSNDRFYFTNSQLANLLNVGETVISLGIKKLKDIGFIELGYKVKAGGGKIRFLKIKNPTFKIQKSDFYFLKGNNNKINNNKKNNIIINNNSKAEILQETYLLDIKEEEKEKSSAKKEKEVIYNEYDFVEEFIDKNNGTIQYLLNKDKDYIKKQSKYVDKLIKQGYDIETIKTVLNFIKQDDFWRKNILSVEKLLRKNKDGVPYIVVMIEKIKQYRPKAIDLDSLYINN